MCKWLFQSSKSRNFFVLTFFYIKLFVEPSQRTRTRPQATWVHVGGRANTRIRESGGTLLYGQSRERTAAWLVYGVAGATAHAGLSSGLWKRRSVGWSGCMPARRRRRRDGGFLRRRSCRQSGLLSVIIAPSRRRLAFVVAFQTTAVMRPARAVTARHPRDATALASSSFLHLVLRFLLL